MSSNWRSDPLLDPPFGVLEQDGKACVLDQEGRILTYDLREKELVRELAKVMNENSERLVEAWKKDTRQRKG